MNLLVPGKVMHRLLPSPTACSKSADNPGKETPKHLKKIWLVMKLMVFFSLVCTLSVNANVYSQQVSVSFKDAGLEKVFREIKKQTGYSFIYTLSMLEKGSKATFTVKNASLEQALTECFRSQPFDYNIVDKTVIVRLKKNIVEFAAMITELPPITVTGRITDADGKPLEGVSIQVKGGPKGVFTDENGAFIIKEVNEKDILVISYVGYKTTEISVQGRSVISIKLTEGDAKLSEVVVIGYGTQKNVLSPAPSHPSKGLLSKTFPHPAWTALYKGRPLVYRSMPAMVFPVAPQKYAYVVSVQ
jgi:hypothetical protein